LEDPVVPELLAQVEELQEELRKLRNPIYHDVWKYEILSVEPLKIRGIALKEGRWNGVWYPAEEIKKVKDKLVGVPLLVEHGEDPKFKRTQVGRVVKAIWEPFFKSLLFEAEITCPKARQMILDGKFKAVSMATLMHQRISSKGKEGYDFEFQELSLVKNPACSVCFVIDVVDKESLSIPKQTTKPRGGEEVSEEKKTETASRKRTSQAFDYLTSILKSVPEELRELVELHIDLSDLGEGETPRILIHFGKKKPEKYEYPYEYPEKKPKKKSEDIVEEEDSAYTDFMKKCLAQGKTMKECAEEWKRQYRKYPEYKYPEKKSEELTEEKAGESPKGETRVEEPVEEKKEEPKEETKEAPKEDQKEEKTEPVEAKPEPEVKEPTLEEKFKELKEAIEKGEISIGRLIVEEYKHPTL